LDAIEQAIDLPVLRPLLTYDKNEIIQAAEEDRHVRDLDPAVRRLLRAVRAAPPGDARARRRGDRARGRVRTTTRCSTRIRTARDRGPRRLSTPPLRPWHRVVRFAVEHQGLAVPLAYVALVLLGMFHMALYYWRFGVNVIAFAQPVDFLLSPLADVFVIVVSILPVFAFFGIKRIDRWFGNFVRTKRGIVRTPEQVVRDERLYQFVQVGGTLLWIVAFSLTYSRLRAERVERGRKPSACASSWPMASASAVRATRRSR
jgi:hypothetical protein